MFVQNNIMSQKKRLFLLDAYGLIFRGYYALIRNPIINSKGQDTSAIMGFMNSLFDLVRREKPDHLAVCFDKDGSAERTELFEDYKANREATPEVIKQSVPVIKEILEAMNIPILELSGIEADDIIGTLAKQAEKQDYEVYMVSSDTDLAQLVSENIFMYRPARMGNSIEKWGIPEVQERFGVERPEQVTDYLGMTGDPSDNIPGIPGVGDKTAKKFLAEYGSLENLLQNTDDLKGKMKERVIENAELGLLSKRLATIDTNCDVTFHEEEFKLTRPDGEKVQQIFEDLEFRRLKDQFINIFSGDQAATPANATSTPAQSAPAGSGQYALFGQDGEPTGTIEVYSSRKNIENTPHFYQIVHDGIGKNLFFRNLMNQNAVGIELLTTSSNCLEAELAGMAFSWEKGKGFYLPFPENQLEAQLIIEELRDFLEREDVQIIGQNLKNDLKTLAKYKITIKGKLFDTMIAHYLINPDMRHDLLVLSETYLNYTPIPAEDIIGKGRKQIGVRDVPVEEQARFTTENADLIFQLKEHFEKELGEANTHMLFDEIEIPLLRVLTAMEMEGINLDSSFLKSLAEDLERDILILEKSIYESAGEVFNIASPKQLGDILFGKMKLIEKPKKTRTGQFSTAEEVLTDLAKDHKIIRDVLEYRGLAKLKSTYVDALPDQVEKTTGRVHTEFVQTVAATGRLSSNNPNLQNIPIRTERGRQVRKAFIPRDKDYDIVSADYSQIELRVIASLSGETNMIEAFKNKEDIHASTASRVFNVPLSEVTREQRDTAKTVNFGIIYGVSAFGLSNQTNLSRTEAKELIDTYYKTYPILRNYISDQIQFARDHGYVQTVFGRRRYLKDINARNPMVRGAAERNAVNAPIQGSAADIIKVAMINIQEKLEKGNFKSKMLLQVHDELVFDIFKSEWETLKPIIKHEMENAYALSVPLIVDLGIGANWLEAH